VVGIAGPGETLATDHALRTFRAIHRQFPKLIKCLSTNGLMLAARAEELVAVGVRTVTVTVNAVDPEVLQQICVGVLHEGKWLHGADGAEILITAQLAAIRKATNLGLFVKTNVVLVPGVNDHHIEAVAGAVKDVGASFVNVIPLIPQHEMADREPPTCGQLNAARDAVEKYLPAFRHCRQCRADACGIPSMGKDLASSLYEEPVQTFSHG
jgi:nitrogen fixation protein NifB